MWFAVVSEVFKIKSNLTHLRWKAQSCHLVFVCGTGKRICRPEKGIIHMRIKWGVVTEMASLEACFLFTTRVYFYHKSTFKIQRAASRGSNFSVHTPRRPFKTVPLKGGNDLMSNGWRPHSRNVFQTSGYIFKTLYTLVKASVWQWPAFTVLLVLWD